MNRRAAITLVLVAGLTGTALTQEKTRSQERLEREVRHELVMLPYYGVFDNLAFRVDGVKVTLLGEVTRPTLRSDAEAVVKKIEGVESVDNQIEVLPLSPNDDRIRLAVYRAVYQQASLSRYALQAIPPQSTSSSRTAMSAWKASLRPRPTRALPTSERKGCLACSRSTTIFGSRSKPPDATYSAPAARATDEIWATRTLGRDSVRW